MSIKEKKKKYIGTETAFVARTYYGSSLLWRGFNAADSTQQWTQRGGLNTAAESTRQRTQRSSGLNTAADCLAPDFIGAALT